MLFWCICAALATSTSDDEPADFDREPTYLLGRILAVRETLGRTDWTVAIDEQIGPRIDVPETIHVLQPFGCSANQCASSGGAQNVDLAVGARVLLDAKDLRRSRKTLVFNDTQLLHDSNAWRLLRGLRFTALFAPSVRWARKTRPSFGSRPRLPACGLSSTFPSRAAMQ